jgi:hypothetical protein
MQHRLGRRPRLVGPRQHGGRRANTVPRRPGASIAPGRALQRVACPACNPIRNAAFRRRRRGSDPRRGRRRPLFSAAAGTLLSQRCTLVRRAHRATRAWERRVGGARTARVTAALAARPRAIRGCDLRGPRRWRAPACAPPLPTSWMTSTASPSQPARVRALPARGVLRTIRCGEDTAVRFPARRREGPRDGRL